MGTLGTANAPDPETFYTLGATACFASTSDQRLSYFLYVPTNPIPARTVVIQHGSERWAAALRDQYASFAERYRCVVIAPLFPAGLIDPTDVHNYKFLEFRGIRFDLELLSIVDQVADRYSLDPTKFFLHGFSGGGQFAHRFLYLHPHRLGAVSIGAPGRVTLLDASRDWWVGTRGAAEKFGLPLDAAAIADVPVHMVVGADDVDEWEINNVGGSNWMAGAEKAGRTRVQRLQTLAENLRSNGVNVRFDVVPGLGHDGLGVADRVQEFFASLWAVDHAEQAHRPITQ